MKYKFLFLLYVVVMVSGCSKETAGPDPVVTESFSAIQFEDSAQLVSGRGKMAATTSGHLAFFAGGASQLYGYGLSDIDIYNANTDTWSNITLGQARHGIKAVSVGSMVLFAGGYGEWGIPSNKVEIYNAETGARTNTVLPNSMIISAAVTVGHKAMFIGITSSIIDIYNVQNGTWSTDTLSNHRFSGVAGVTSGNLVFFAGGQDGSGYSSRVDIYNNVTNTWTTAELSEPRSAISAAAAGDLILFAGGVGASGESKRVDIYNKVTNTWTTDNFSAPKAGMVALNIGNLVVFAGGGRSTAITPANSIGAIDELDVYNTTTKTWTSLTLKHARYLLAGTKVNDKLIFAGGMNPVGVALRHVEIYQAIP